MKETELRDHAICDLCHKPIEHACAFYSVLVQKVLCQCHKR